MNEIFDKLGISQKNRKLTKVSRKEKFFTKVKDVTPPIEDLNFMADILMLPVTKNKFRYVLSVVDLASDEFDIEPLKKKDSKTVLNAIKKIFNRRYLNIPDASIQTDKGTEFKGIFNEYFYNKNIIHKTALKGRHKQMSNVESLNRQLSKLFNGYMNSVELQTGEEYNEWVDVIDIVRDELNKIRKKKTYTKKEYIQKIVPNIGIFEPDDDPKFDIGDIVYRKLDIPQNARGDDMSGGFREGDFRYDKVPRKIIKTLYYNGKVSYRYVLEGFPQVSYTEKELIRADEDEEQFEIKKIIGKKKIKNRIHYLVWWKGNLKKDATYEPRKRLIKDGAKDLIDEFEQNHKF